MDIPNVATRSLISTAASWWPAGHPLARSRAILIAIGVFALLFLLTDWISPGPLTYFDVTSVASGGTPLALAAVGQTLVILSADSIFRRARSSP